MRGHRMGNNILIIGESGSGKSTAIRTLDPKETFLINVIGKPMPFKGFRKSYLHIENWANPDSDMNFGNLYVGDNYQAILKCIELVKSRKDIKTLIIDDWQYILANEYMRRASETGFSKFSEIAQHAWMLINSLSNTRPDLVSFFISHSDTDEFGKIKCKTIGKMLNEKISIEGLFTTVLHSVVNDDGHYFMTQTDGRHLAKSPVGMFEDKLIPNDLLFVINKIKKYEEE